MSIFANRVWLTVALFASILISACAAQRDAGAPRIALSPREGGPLTTLEVQGNQFLLGTYLEIRLGPPVTGASPESYGSATVDDSGQFSASFLMPATWPDGQPIEEAELLVVAISEDGRVRATAPFNYHVPESPTPTLVLNPATVAPGTTISVSGAGFVEDTEVGLRLRVLRGEPATGILAEAVSSAQGAFDTFITIPQRWPGSQKLIDDEQLVVVAIDRASGEQLATAPLLNAPSLAPSELYEALDEQACTRLQETVTQALDVQVRRASEAAPFVDVTSGASGESCRLSASGSGEDFSRLVDVAAALRLMFEREGWIVENRYVAYSPTETTFAMRQPEALAVIKVQWSPIRESACLIQLSPAECAALLAPSQMLFQITIDLAQPG